MAAPGKPGRLFLLLPRLASGASQRRRMHSRPPSSQPSHRLPRGAHPLAWKCHGASFTASCAVPGSRLPPHSAETIPLREMKENPAREVCSDTSRSGVRVRKGSHQVHPSPTTCGCPSPCPPCALPRPLPRLYHLLQPQSLLLQRLLPFHHCPACLTLQLSLNFVKSSSV